MHVHHAISIPAAAELCRVGEPAIRRAFREGRISPCFRWVVGGGETITYLNLDSVLACYEMTRAEVFETIKEWALRAPVVRTRDEREWVIFDRAPVMILREPPEHAA